MNEEKFFKEYWLQKKVERVTSYSKKITTTGDKSISYKFVFDDIINLNINLDNNGNLTIARHLPATDSSLDKTLYYYTEISNFNSLSRDFHHT